jgi:hypothetical protein
MESRKTGQSLVWIAIGLIVIWLAAWGLFAAVVYFAGEMRQ